MADLLLTNGKLYTMNPARPHANAIAFANGRVVAFDDDAHAMRDARTEVIDLRGRAAIPGLVDAHIHFTGYATSIARVQLDGARSLEEAVARVAARVQAVKPGGWVLGMGWNHLDWAQPEFPTKTPLDAIAPNNPIVLDRKDGHSVWLNSAALRAANITRETPDPPGGIVERDAAGEPTGLLRENAIALLGNSIGFEADKISGGELLNAIRTAHRMGLTGICNVEGANALRAFQNLRAQGQLTLRVMQMIPVENLEHAIAVGLQTGLGDEFLRIGGVKIFADGSLGSQTAWMLEPFEGYPENHGVAVTPPEEIERLVRAAAQAGLMVATHAIGDRAIREALNVYEKVRREKLDAVLRIEHAQHLHPADTPRFRALNVIASMQPVHATSDYKMADQLLGARARYAYAFRSLLNAGATLAFGSDCPVETLDPLAGIHAAVTRERANGEPRGGWYPEEKISVEEAVRSYIPPPPPSPASEGGSWSGGIADCIVLSQDIFTIPPRQILSTRVDYTIVGGKIVYAAE
jgi:predicted amidohydrolase YtcJ